jgi:hypothetical protein
MSSQVDISPPVRRHLPTSAIFLGIVIGYSLAIGLMPGGYDALLNFLRFPFDDTTAPAWVYLVTAPLGYIPWPLRWMLWMAVTLVAARWAHRVLGGQRWWIALFSLPMLWNLWLGNLEVFSILGVGLGFLVLQKKLHPFWWGIGLLALATKPQVGLGILILVSWWIWREQGVRSLAWGGVSALLVLAVTILIWPGWIPKWIHAVITLYPTWWNGSIFPYGLVAWPLALMPVKISKNQRLRMVAAANLLGSPYLALYHCTTLMITTERASALVTSWVLLAAGWLFTRDWMKIAWLLPAFILLLDGVDVYRKRQIPVPAGTREDSL